MSTQGCYKDAESFARLNKTPIRTTIESAFYGNNVVSVPDLKMAYRLAKDSPGTVELTGMPIHRAEDIGLPGGSNALLFNDGSVVGRCAAARRIIGYQGVNTLELASVLREAVYGTRHRKLYHGETVIGLDEDFMVKANLLIPEGYENNLLSWMLNFQYFNDEYRLRYDNSRPIEGNGDIFIICDPDWKHADYPLGLAVFSPEQNCAAVLGMRYFGEIKKGDADSGLGRRVAQWVCILSWGVEALQEQGRCQVLCACGVWPVRFRKIYCHPCKTPG